jgi:hypothetical protein
VKCEISNLWKKLMKAAPRAALDIMHYAAAEQFGHHVTTPKMGGRSP